MNGDDGIEHSAPQAPPAPKFLVDVCFRFRGEYYVEVFEESNPERFIRRITSYGFLFRCPNSEDDTAQVVTGDRLDFEITKLDHYPDNAYRLIHPSRIEYFDVRLQGSKPRYPGTLSGLR